MAKAKLKVADVPWGLDDLVTMEPAEILTRLETRADVKELNEWALICDGDLRRMVQDRIASLLRAAPITGRCLEERTESLPCALTDEEAVMVATKAIQAGRDAEARMEGFKAKAKGEKMTAEMHGRIRDRAIRDHQEARPVQVQELLSGDTVRIVRMDTGELLDSRPATEDEMQEPMPFGRDPTETM